MADLRQIAVATAVAILFSLFVILLIDVVYTEPTYSNYCKGDSEVPPVRPIEQPKCDYEYGEGYTKCTEEGGAPRFTYNESGCSVFDRCDYCSKDYDYARKAYSRNIFIVVGLIGLISIFAGTVWEIEFLGTGFMFGGIILLLYATIRYFEEADKLLRVIIIFIEMLVVLWIGYKKLYKDAVKKEKGRKGKV